nr:hypothetical protein [Pelagibius sp. Alg239-R121]
MLAGQAVSTLRRSEKPDGQSYGNQSGAQGKKQKSDRKEKAFLQHAFGVDVALEDVLEQQRDRAGDEGSNAGHLNFGSIGIKEREVPQDWLQIAEGSCHQNSR